MYIQDKHLPHLLIALHDASQLLREAYDTFEEPGQALCQRIEQWEQSLFEQVARSDPSIPFEKVIAHCRQAPPSLLLDALILQQEALRTLSENEDIFGGPSTEGEAFWSEEGEGYCAIEIGKSALSSTWWPYYPCLRAWANTSSEEILMAVQHAEKILRTQADRQAIIEPCVQHLAALRCQLISSNKQGR